MSRIGKKIIEIPQGVSINLENKEIIVTGKHGSLKEKLIDNLSLEINGQEVEIKRLNETKITKSCHGLTRALVQNMVTGVSEKFSKVIVAEGVGYKFQVDKQKLIVSAGFSHPVEIIIPEELTIKQLAPTKIAIEGINKEKVGFLAAKIREIRPPEPYKGKGLMYENEKIIRKAGKTGK